MFNNKTKLALALLAVAATVSVCRALESKGGDIRISRENVLALAKFAETAKPEEVRERCQRYGNKLAELLGGFRRSGDGKAVDSVVELLARSKQHGDIRELSVDLDLLAGLRALSG